MFLTLKSKILLVFIGLVVISSALNIGIASFATKKNLTDDLIKRIIVNTKSEVNDLTNFVLIGDKEGIINLIYNQKIAHKDASYFLVLDENNKIIASTIVNKNPDDFINYNLLAQGENEKVVLIQRGDGEEIYDIAVRLDYNKGVLRVGYFKGQIDSSVLSILYSLIFGFILSLIIALIFAFLFTKVILRPLDNLQKVAQKISSGDFSVRAEVLAKDEIGFLALSFNHMSENLQKSYSNLERAVEEKTSELSKKVTEVEKSKLAILNLLEDIKEEKENVEKRVIERTRELKEEQAKMTASINSLSFSFMVIDMNHNVILKNKAAEELFDFGKWDQISMIQIQEALGGDLNIKEEASRCILGGKACEVKDIFFQKKILRGIIAPIITAHAQAKKGEAIGYVLLLEDITERKVAERSKDEFFAVASHELRTPLTAIRGNTEMIEDMYGDKIVDKDMKEMLADIHEASVRLIGIVNEFLEVSRLEQGRINLEKKPFDIVELINTTIRDLKNSTVQKNISLVFEKPIAQIPQVVGDKDRIAQVLINLIGNSVKFTNEGGGITIKIEKEDSQVKVFVSDTGIGVSPENQVRLFRKFQQAGEEMLSRDVTQGTGLGLYICRLLIEKMGGSIDLVKSELGKGSTFYFTIPLVS